MDSEYLLSPHARRPGRVRHRSSGVHIRLSAAGNVCYRHASHSYPCAHGSTMPSAVIAPAMRSNSQPSRRAGVSQTRHLLDHAPIFFPFCQFTLPNNLVTRSRSPKIGIGVESMKQHEPVGPARTWASICHPDRCSNHGGVTVSTGSIAA